MTVTIKPLTHGGEACYAILFAYEVSLKELIKELQYVRYTATHKCFYVFTKNWNLEALERAILAKGITVTKDPALTQSSIKIPVPVIEQGTHFILKPIEVYRNYLVGLRLSKSTVETYSVFISNFFLFLHQKLLTEVTNEDVRLFVEQQVRVKNYKISTHRQLISAIKHFATLQLDSKIDIDALQRPYKSKYLPTVLSTEEVLELLRVAKNLKHRAALALLYSSGLRIGELISLELHMIDIDRKQLVVKQGKGRKDRVVVLAEGFIGLLKNYYLTYRPKQYFIENPTGGPYSAGSIRQFIKRYGKAAGIRKNITPHTLRHSYATHLIENGVGLRYVQDLLGHSKPETTMIYTHVARKDLLQIQSPLDTALQSLAKRDKELLKLPFSDNFSG
ncbi:tyrosine-type recombinase/integrase [Rasiella sp. SM2506]|uniref:tyrosine-type recombinase/integrase n=1 Tax=Rasiella sp. SM2506 TaxID=3423914 RepID=UPI003D7ABD1A